MQNRSLLLALVLSVWVLAALCALPAIPVFDCPSLPTPPAATNVNQLRPGNIKVVMAVGDSITAGFAMNAAHITNFLKINSDIKESRQDVFSIGGSTSNSLPSYFSFYNPSIQGASIGQTSPVSLKNDYMVVALPDASIARLNAAESGAIADDIISQINYLRDTMLSPLYASTIDFKNDWKHLTVLIGANNLCQACVNETRASPDNYEAALDGAFSYLRSQIPRVFVSVITMFKLSTVYNTFQTSSYCKTARATVFTTECLCIAKDYSAAGLQKVDDYSVEYNNRLYKLAAKYQALNDPEFTIKVQPATQNFSIPSSIGVQFLSEFDCFHPSAFADATMGVALWNNIMAGSQANKQTTIDPFNSKITCPDDNTYLV